MSNDLGPQVVKGFKIPENLYETWSKWVREEKGMTISGYMRLHMQACLKSRAQKTGAATE